MIAFALRNIAAYKARSIAFSSGVAIAFSGFIGLSSVSAGLETSIAEYYEGVAGAYVVGEGSIDPLFSSVPLDALPALERVAGVASVNPEIWCLSSRVEGDRSFSEGLSSFVTLGGLDPASYRGPYRNSLVEGVFPDGTAQGRCLVSRAIARIYGKKLGDGIEVNGRSLSIGGIYSTGSLYLDCAVILPLEEAYAFARKAPGFVSAYYLTFEGENGEDLAEAALRASFPGLELKGKETVGRDFSGIMGSLDAFFGVLYAGLALISAALILFSGLWNFRERRADFAVLLIEGWRSGDLLLLMVEEASALIALGVAAGVGIAAGLLPLVSRAIPFAPRVRSADVLAAIAIAAGMGLASAFVSALQLGRFRPLAALRSE
jgi:hypothetical protein